MLIERRDKAFEKAQEALDQATFRAQEITIELQEARDKLASIQVDLQNCHGSDKS